MVKLIYGLKKLIVSSLPAFLSRSTIPPVDLLERVSPLGRLVIFSLERVVLVRSL